MRGVVTLTGAGFALVVPMFSILANSAASNAAICLFDSTRTLIVVLSFVASRASLLSAVLMPLGGPCAITTLA